MNDTVEPIATEGFLAGKVLAAFMPIEIGFFDGADTSSIGHLRA